MNIKLQKISHLAKEFSIVLPPGAYFDYPKSGLTYLFSSEENNEYLADNPYIFEYLLYNRKNDWLSDVSHMHYIGKESINQLRAEDSVFVFFFEEIIHFLDFNISRTELPVFKIFIDHLAFYRKEGHKKNSTLLFPWNYKLFQKYAESVTHQMEQDELLLFHRRLCDFHQSHFPAEALKNLFEN